MAGVVYGAGGSSSMGKFGLPITLAASAVIPPGQYFSLVAWTSVIDGTPHTMPAGYMESDGLATSAGGQLIPLGAGLPMLPWPWRPPWPLPGSGA